MWILFPVIQKDIVVVKIGVVTRGSSLESLSHGSTNALGLQQGGDTLEDSKSSWQDDPVWLQLSSKSSRTRTVLWLSAKVHLAKSWGPFLWPSTPASAMPACPPSSSMWRPLVQCWLIVSSALNSCFQPRFFPGFVWNLSEGRSCLCPSWHPATQRQLSQHSCGALFNVNLQFGNALDAFFSSRGDVCPSNGTSNCK